MFKSLISKFLFVFALIFIFYPVSGHAQTIGSLNVFSPASGSNWNVGTQQVIRWNFIASTTPVFPPGTTFKIDLFNATSHLFTIANNIPTQTNATTSVNYSYNWTVPSFAGPGYNYRVKVSAIASTTIASGYSYYFNIRETLPPSITITSPNGGEVWNKNEKHRITWVTQNVPLDAYVVTWLCTAPIIIGGGQCTPVPNADQVGSGGTRVNVDTLQDGKYYARSRVYTNYNYGTAAEDNSDNLFTIRKIEFATPELSSDTSRNQQIATILQGLGAILDQVKLLMAQ